MPASDYKDVLNALARDPAKLDEYRKRIVELSYAMPLRDARNKAAQEFKQDAIDIITVPDPLPEPAKPPDPDNPEAPAAEAPAGKQKRLTIDPTEDIEYAYAHWHLTGDAFDKAKLRAPSGGAVSMLIAVNEDVVFRKYFFKELVPRVIHTRDKIERNIKRTVTSRPILELIRKTLKKARHEAGLDRDTDDDDGDTGEEMAQESAESDVAEPSVPAIAD